MTAKDIFKICATNQTQVYKGYLIKFNDLHNEYYISKDNTHICTSKTISEAKCNIDLIAN